MASDPGCRSTSVGPSMIRSVPGGHRMNCRLSVGAVVLMATAVEPAVGQAPSSGSGSPRPGTYWLTERVSVGSSGVEGNSQTFDTAISSSGRYVVFVSLASNLVPGDRNGAADVFVRDRRTGTTHCASVASNGARGNRDSGANGVSISADGRFVVFGSLATNMVPLDTNASEDIFVRDLVSGITKRVSVDSAGLQGNGSCTGASMTPDGRYVLFASIANNLVPSGTGYEDIFVRDLVLETTTRVSVDSTGAQSDGHSLGASISADGRYVAFGSNATNLVALDTNGRGDAFVRDLVSGTTERVSVDSAGAQANGESFEPSISADGRFVAFVSVASNLVPGDTNGWADIFVRDRESGTTERVSLDSRGAQGNDGSGGPSISADGRFVAFGSFASNFARRDKTQDWDAFVRDRLTGVTLRASVDPSGRERVDHGYDRLIWPHISSSGRFVVFVSSAALVPFDTNYAPDAFVRTMY